MKRSHLGSLMAVAFAAVFFEPDPALAQAYLGTNLSPFAVLAGTTVTCTGASNITGNVGVSPGSATVGFPTPCAGVPIIPPASDPAQANLLTAYNTLAAQPCSSTVGPDLVGLTLVQGVYCVGGAPTNLSGTLLLDAQGNPNAVWVFRMSSTLITSSGSTVSVINGGNQCGAQWQVSSSATLGSGTTFLGNILALTSITLDIGSNLTGRALARNGAVTLDTNNVSFAACGVFGPPPPFPGPVPTLPEIGAWALLLVLLGSGVYLLSRRTPTEASR
jgi:hypothetical protein